MKRLIAVVLAFICCVLCGCSAEMEGWKSVHIEKCGTIQIPDDWEFVVEDEIIYITQNETPLMISYQRTGRKESNSYFSDFTYIDMSTSAVLSNSAIYGKAKYSYSGQEIERYYLHLGETTDGKLIEFLVWSEEIDEKLLIKIAKTFTLE